MSHELTQVLASVVLFCGIAPLACAAPRENPYLAIARRSPFALKAAVPFSPPPPERPASPLGPLVSLTGITDLPGWLTVTFQYEDRQTRRVRYSALLAEGQGDDTLTVLQIDPVNALVRVKCGEADTTLDFLHNGLKPSVPPAVSAPPVPPSVPKPGLSREEAEALIERRRQEFRTLEASGQSVSGRGAAIISPPLRSGPGGGIHP